MRKRKPTGTVQATSTMGVEKIHGPNSPDVLAGRRQVGDREHIEGEKKLIEVDFDVAVNLFGEEKARELFSKRDTEASNAT